MAEEMMISGRPPKSQYETSPSGESGAGLVEVSGTPTIYNVIVASADTEVSKTLSSNTKQFFIKLRGQTSKLRVAFVTGGADASTGTFITIPANGFLSPAGLNLTNTTLFFETSSGSQVLEILEWV